MAIGVGPPLGVVGLRMLSGDWLKVALGGADEAA
jgi:hypothetical protein